MNAKLSALLSAATLATLNGVRVENTNYYNVDIVRCDMEDETTLFFDDQEVRMSDVDNQPLNQILERLEWPEEGEVARHFKLELFIYAPLGEADWTFAAQP